MNCMAASIGLLIAAGSIYPGLAAAQAVIRCVNAYGEQPCPGGTVVPAADPRTEAQRAQASAAIARDARMAQVLEAARLKAEARAPATETAPMTRLPEPAASPAGRSGKSKAAKPFKAVARDKPSDNAHQKGAAKKNAKASRKKAHKAPRASYKVS